MNYGVLLFFLLFSYTFFGRLIDFYLKIISYINKHVIFWCWCVICTDDLNIKTLLDYRKINIFLLKQNLRDLSIGSEKRGRCKRDGYVNSGRKRGEKRWRRWGDCGRSSSNGDREQVAATESGEYSVSLYGLWLRRVMALPLPCFIFFLKLQYTYALSLHSNNIFLLSTYSLYICKQTKTIKKKRKKSD